MYKWRLTLLGTGMLGNSPVTVNEVFEIDNKTYTQLQQSNQAKNDIIKGLLAVRCPGVLIEPDKLQKQYQEIRVKKETPKKEIETKEKKILIKKIVRFLQLQ